MSTNINNTGQNICLFCYCTTYQFQEIQNDATLNQIVTTCNKHLPRECSVNINWENANGATKSFCQECCNSAQQLLTLNSDLERILKDKEALSAHFANRILSGRKHFELSNTKFRNLNETVKDSSTFNIPSPQSPSPNTATRTSITNFGNLTFQTSENTYDVDFVAPNECNSKSSEDFTIASTEDNPCESESSQTNVNQNKKPRQLKRPLDRHSEGRTAGDRIPTITTGSDLQRHIDNDIPSGFPCEKCHKRFTRLTSLQKHNCWKPTFECEVCNTSFLGTGALKLHMRCHTGEKPHKCDTCRKSFSVRSNLTNHLRLHSEGKSFKCGICQKSFKDDKCLRQHLLTHKRKERKYKCHICSKSLSTLYGLKTHLLYHSKEERPHKCPTCGKGYTQEFFLQKHERTHLKVKPFTCELCGKGFFDNYSLRKHMNTHSKVKGFLCEECGKSFSVAQSLAVHTLTHTENGPFVCVTCGKTYPSSVSLKNHIHFYHSEKTLKCDLCHKGFHIRADLHNHTKRGGCKLDTTSNVNKRVFCTTCENCFEDGTFESHHHKSNIKCHFCPALLDSACQFKCHLQTHHPNGDSIYKCKICNNPSERMTVSELRIHMKSVHPNVSTDEEESEFQKSSPSSYSSRTRSMKEKKRMGTETVSSLEGENERGNTNDDDGTNGGNKDDEMEVKVEYLDPEVKQEDDDYILST